MKRSIAFYRDCKVLMTQQSKHLFNKVLKNNICFYYYIGCACFNNCDAVNGEQCDTTLKVILYTVSINVKTKTVNLK